MQAQMAYKAFIYNTIDKAMNVEISRLARICLWAGESFVNIPILLLGYIHCRPKSEAPPASELTTGSELSVRDFCAATERPGDVEKQLRLHNFCALRTRINEW